MEEQQKLKDKLEQMKANPVRDPSDLLYMVVQSSLQYWRYHMLQKESQEDIGRDLEIQLTGEEMCIRDRLIPKGRIWDLRLSSSTRMAELSPIWMSILWYTSPIHIHSSSKQLEREFLGVVTMLERMRVTN